MRRDPHINRIFTALLPLLFLSAFALPAAAYPWMHYFERPDHPYIHRAFSDGGGDLIVSTGDWLDWDWAGVYIDVYWSTGIFRIDGADIHEVACPENTFVLDAAVDTEGRAWVTYGTGLDHYDYDSELISRCSLSDFVEAPIDYVDIGPHHGYRPWYSPHYDVIDTKIGIISTDVLTEIPELTSAIPGEFLYLNSNRLGRKFVVSRDRSSPWDDYEYHLSWWDGDDLESLRVVDLPDDDSPIYDVYDFPFQGRDGRIFLRVGFEGSSVEGAILSIHPEDMEWSAYSWRNSPLPNGYIRYFYMDGLDTMWLMTTDGLLCFDGSNWAVCTTDNTDLPHNEVKQLAYDELENLYYVITQTELGPMRYVAALSILTPTGSKVTAPMYFPETSYPFDHPIICRDDNGVWWLCSFNTSEVYSYDHRQIICWNSDDWLGSEDRVGYIGSMASGGSFCIAGHSGFPHQVMIW